MNAEAFMAWYDAQPDGKRYELLDGCATPMFADQMQSERLMHAETKARICEIFRQQIRQKRLACQALGDGMAVRIDEETVFEPDALVRCGPQLPGETSVILDPFIVVEVASPSTQNIDALHKLTLYFRNPHILHYLIVLPVRKMVVHHWRLEDGQIRSAIAGEGVINFDPPGLALDVADLFAEA